GLLRLTGRPGRGRLARSRRRAGSERAEVDPRKPHQRAEEECPQATPPRPVGVGGKRGREADRVERPRRDRRGDARRDRGREAAPGLAVLKITLNRPARGGGG